MHFVVPKGWTLPAHNTICQCKVCGMIWYDNECTQAEYDRYYKERYGWDGTDGANGDKDRLSNVATWAESGVLFNREAVIMDFGGGNGYLADQLRSRGYKNAYTVGVGDEIPVGKNDMVVACHVLEHLYDLRPILSRVIDSLRQGGRFVAEIPTTLKMLNVVGWPILDFHQKHINHFDPFQLDLLFYSYGFMPISRYEYNYAVRGNAPQYRAMYQRMGADGYYTLEDFVEGHVNRVVERLRNVRGPVIIWGCGDFCLHVLTKVKLEVKHFIDLDPAFKDCTILGRPVLMGPIDSVTPILVMAQMQKSSILRSIKEQGYKNPVIEL